ncbi:MAG TPA: HD domain-containing protein, partial [Fimbriimonadaceae bacterium]|nr:HD domain-containing protein [Fimbriimonadaceae bacterium]
MTEALSHFAEELAERRREVIESLRARPSGRNWCRRHSGLVDEAVAAVYDECRDAYGSELAVAIVATGGYGRSELAPYSDADLTVIPLDEAAADLDEPVKRLFRDLHDLLQERLGLDVGYQYRLVNDAPALDGKTRTALVDGRLVAGDPRPWNRLQELFWETFPTGEFVFSKIGEREAAWKKFNDTPLAVVLQLKEGAGGLRSLQAANWIRTAIGEQPSGGGSCYEQILKFRNLLHLVSGKHQDLLTRQKQADLADLLSVDVYAMMSEVAEAALELHKEFEGAVDRIQEARFSLNGGVVALRGEARVLGTSSTSEAAVGIAIATSLGLRVADLPAGTTGAVDPREALFALGSGEATLRNLIRCGLLQQLLPELNACLTLMPRDSSHEFSVFEHTLRVVRNLESLQPGTFLYDLLSGLRERDPLFLAALLHDAGKAVGGRPHSETGEELVHLVGGRWKLAPQVTALVSWLVREHLSMARFVRMRDVANPQTALEFATLVGTLERLDMLTLLTWADINAVSSDAWTPAQEATLRELYERTRALLSGESSAEADPGIYRKRLMREMRNEAVSEEDIQAFLDRLPAHYLFATPPEVVRLHLKYEQMARAGQPTVDLYDAPELGASEVTVCCPDEPGLLSKMLGVFYALDLSILGIRASTTRSETPIALDVFTLSFGGRPIPSATAAELSRLLMNVLRHELDPLELLASRGKDPNRRQEFFTYAFIEGSPGILEVQAPRGRGMAYRMSRLIAENGWNTSAARVGQWAGRGAAAFYISRADGTA